MTPKSTQSRQNQRTQSSGGVSRGSVPKGQSQKRTGALSVRNILIEPREDEPPRISVSVEYESDAPSVQALKKAAMEAVHSVVRAQTFVDLGERQNVQRGELTKCFEVRKKEAG